MIFNWNDTHIQRDIVYFKFDFNNENWLFSTLNKDISLINITKSWHKTYLLRLNKNTGLFEVDTRLFTAKVSIRNKEINIESKNNA